MGGAVLGRGKREFVAGTPVRGLCARARVCARADVCCVHVCLCVLHGLEPPKALQGTQAHTHGSVGTKRGQAWSAGMECSP